MRSFRLSRPILDLEIRNPRELTHIPSHQNEIMHDRDSCDLQIQRADHTGSNLKIMAYRSVKIRTAVVEREGDNLIQRPNYIPLSSSSIRILFRSMHQFCTDWRTSREIRHRVSIESADQTVVPTLEDFDPDIRVQEITHQQDFVGGKEDSGGSSNSMSAQQPMISANSGILRFNSSMLGNSSSPAASDNASRTRDSSAFAFSGSRRSKVLSSSVAIAVTEEACHPFILFPIQFSQKPVSH